MELTEIKYTRRSTIGGPGSYDYEIVEMSAAVEPVEDTQVAYSVLKGLVEAQLTSPSAAPAAAPSNGNGNNPYGGYNSNSKQGKGPEDMYCSWPGLPYEMSSKPEIKQALKDNKCWFNGKKSGGDNVWYCPTPPNGLNAISKWMELKGSPIPDSDPNEADDLPF